jgi:hypothetical protein
MPQTNFADALQRLVNDGEYRRSVMTDEARLLTDYPMSGAEIALLSAVWETVKGGKGREHEEESLLLLCDWHACCCCFWE